MKQAHCPATDSRYKTDPAGRQRPSSRRSQNRGNSEAIYGIHEGTNRVTIKIVDKDTKEVIKELPPEKMLDMLARMWEMSGLMVDEKR